MAANELLISIPPPLEVPFESKIASKRQGTMDGSQIVNLPIYGALLWLVAVVVSPGYLRLLCHWL